MSQLSQSNHPKVRETRATTRPARIESRAAAGGADDSATPKVIAGYAAVYYVAGRPETEYRISADFVERITPGAFDDFLASDNDCLGVAYHDERVLLGRRSGSMTLTSDDVGLAYSIPFDAADPDHCALAAKMARGDIRGSSHWFHATAERWIYDEDEDLTIRELTRCQLYHVGPVANPAYDGAVAELRSDAGWDYLMRRKAEFLATREAGGGDEVVYEIDSLLLDL